jgi:hypothetical protein
MWTLVLCPVIWSGICLRTLYVDFPTGGDCRAVMRTVLKLPEPPARVYCISKSAVEITA